MKGAIPRTVFVNNCKTGLSFRIIGFFDKGFVKGVYVKPAPAFLHNNLNAGSLTSSIGARNILFLTLSFFSFLFIKRLRKKGLKVLLSKYLVLLSSY